MTSPSATEPTPLAVLEDAVATSRKCQAGLAPRGGDFATVGLMGAGFPFVAAIVAGTAAGFAPGAAGMGDAGRTLAALAPLVITGGVTVVRAIRSANVAADAGGLAEAFVAGAFVAGVATTVFALEGAGVVVTGFATAGRAGVRGRAADTVIAKPDEAIGWPFVPVLRTPVNRGSFTAMVAGFVVAGFVVAAATVGACPGAAGVATNFAGNTMVCETGCALRAAAFSTVITG